MILSKLVLDISGGISNISTKTPVNSDTMFVTFSCTKAISAFAWHILWERGQLELGHFVREYWPEFGEKELIEAIYDFQNRERRFGKISEQLKVNNG